MKLEIKDSTQTGWLTITTDIGRKFDVEQYEEIEEIVRRVNLHEKLIEALNIVSPVIDGLINRTPTGKQRNELTDINILIKSALLKSDKPQGEAKKEI